MRENDTQRYMVSIVEHAHAVQLLGLGTPSLGHIYLCLDCLVMVD